MKLIDAEKLKAEIEKNTPDRLQLLVYRDIILSLIDSLQQEQQEEPDKSLEEAAQQYAEGPECTWVGTTALEEAFKAGASWQKQQKLKDAVEGTVIKTDKHTSVRYESYYGTDRYFYGIADKQFKAGDKVRIIIVKAEEDKK